MGKEFHQTDFSILFDLAVLFDSFKLSDLKDPSEFVRRLIKQALQGQCDVDQQRSAILLSNLVYYEVGGAFVFNTLANLAVLVRGSISEGYEELSNVYAKEKWYVDLYRSMFSSLGISLRPMVAGYIAGAVSFPTFHCVHVLDSLLLDSAIVRATRSQPLDLKPLYRFFVEKELYKESSPLPPIPPRIEGLTDVAVPFISLIFPFVDLDVSAGRPKILIKGRTQEDVKRLLLALARSSHFSAIYVTKLLLGIYSWKLRKYGESEPDLDEVFERAKTANYNLFLPPEAMARRPYHFVSSMLFKLANALYENVGRSDAVFKPTGNFEEDLRELWGMASSEGRDVIRYLHGIKDESELLKSVEHESYGLFVKVLKTPYEWLSTNFTKFVWKDLLMEFIGAEEK
jgi:hypothetical protein